MRGKTRSRTQRAQGLCLRQCEAFSLCRHVQRSDAGAVGLEQARARDDRGRGLLVQPLLLLPRRPWRGGAGVVRRSGAWRTYGHELSRRPALAARAGDAGFCRKAVGRALGRRGRGPGRLAPGGLQRSRYLGHRRCRRLFQHVEPDRVGDRHAAEQRLSWPGTVNGSRGASQTNAVGTCGVPVASIPLKFESSAPAANNGSHDEIKFVAYHAFSNHELRRLTMRALVARVLAGTVFTAQFLAGTVLAGTVLAGTVLSMVPVASAIAAPAPAKPAPAKP